MSVDKIWVLRDPRGHILGVSAVFANGAVSEASTHASSNEVRRVCDKLRTYVVADRRKRSYAHDGYTLTFEPHVVSDDA